MFTVLVVDDDPLLCNAMRLKIDLVNQESQLELEEVITAHSAYEAHGIMQKQHIDILITDVQMPYQSGLELIEVVSKEYPDIQLVVLSGYSYYEYMRSAMLSGVVDYLLKPVKLRQLKEILIKCLENIRTQRNSQEDMVLRKKQTLDYRTEKYCSALERGNPAEAGNIPEELALPCFYTAVFQTDNSVSFVQLFQEFRMEKEKNAGLLACHLHDARQANILLLNTASEESAVRTYLEEFCAFAASRKTECRCAVSQRGNCLKEYPDLLREARHALSYQLLERFSVRMSRDADRQDSTRYSSELFPKYIRRIQSAFQSRNFELINAFLNEIFTYEFFRDTNATLADIRNFYTYYLTQAQDLAAAYHMDLEEPRHFSDFSSLDEIRLYFKEIHYRLQQQAEKETDKTQYVISTAVKYIEAHYNQEISMNDVASAVSMSYTYFSKFFKEQTQQSFSEYITSVRMREAKRLLAEDPSIKIKDVANLVGYESVYSFSRAFKQYYQMPPKNLREK